MAEALKASKKLKTNNLSKSDSFSADRQYEPLPDKEINLPGCKAGIYGLLFSSVCSSFAKSNKGFMAYYFPLFVRHSPNPTMLEERDTTLGTLNKHLLHMYTYPHLRRRFYVPLLRLIALYPVVMHMLVIIIILHQI
jgi:hypothetical protein